MNKKKKRPEFKDYYEWLEWAKKNILPKFDMKEIIAAQPAKRLQNYYECIGCGNCIDATENRGKCEMCGGQKWIAKTTYIKISSD